MEPQTVPIMVRIRPTSKELLKRAAKAQRRSMASIVDTLIEDHLYNLYSKPSDRLSVLLERNPNEG